MSLIISTSQAGARVRLALAPLVLALILGGAACKQDSRGPLPRPERETSTTGHGLSESQVLPGSLARFYAPTGMVGVSEAFVTPELEMTNVKYLLLTDTLNHTIRRVELSTGLATTYAGTPSVPGSAGSFFRAPTAVAVAVWSTRGMHPPHLFVADTGNHTVRFVHRTVNPTTLQPNTDPSSLHYETVAGTAGYQGYSPTGLGYFDSPGGVAIGSTSGSSTTVGEVLTIFVADTGNHVIRKVFVKEGRVELLAGTPGQPGYADQSEETQAKFNRPSGLAFAANSNKLYVADSGNHVIRVIDLGPDIDAPISNSDIRPIRKLAGTPKVAGHEDGDLDSARFSQPTGLALSDDGLTLRVSDRASYTVRAIDLGGADPQVRTIAGRAWAAGHIDGELGFAAPDLGQGRLRAPSGVAHHDGITYVTDTGNNLVRAITPKMGGTFLSTLVGKREPGAADGYPVAFSFGQPGTIACSGDKLYMDGLGMQVVQLDPGGDSGAVRIVSSSDWTGFTYAGGGVYRAREYSADRLDPATGEELPIGLTGGEGKVFWVASAGTTVLVSTTDTNGIAKLLPDGAGPAMLFGDFAQPIWDGAFSYSPNATGLLKFDPHEVPVVPTQIEVLGLASANARAFAFAEGQAYFTSRNSDNSPRHDIRRIDLASGAIRDFVGSPNQVDPFNAPGGLCIIGNRLYVADTGSRSIRRVDLTTHATAEVALRRVQ